MSQAFEFENQINVFNYYNCEKFDYIIDNCQAFKKINSNNFIKEKKKNTLDQNVKLTKE
jgi:hypothetical protein